MQRNCFLCLVLVLFFAFAAYSGSGTAIAQGTAKKPKAQAGAEKPTVSKQTGAKRGTTDTAKGAGTATEISPGQINARAAILVEVSTGTVLFEQNADEQIEPASFTKIASLYLIFEGLQQGRLHLNDEVWVSESAWRTGGSKMFVAIGSRVPLEDLLKGIAVVSGNDACGCRR